MANNQNPIPSTVTLLQVVRRVYDSIVEAIRVKVVNTGADAIPTRYAGVTDFVTGALSVGGTPVEVKAGPIPLAGRRQLVIYPPDAGTVYWGKGTVSSSIGAPLKSTDGPLILDLEPDQPVSVYLINDGTARSVRVVEAV